MCDKLDENEIICRDLKFDDEDLVRKCVPTQTQIRQALGSKLSDVFFEFLNSESRAYLGLEPPLLGPETVWIAPGARLASKTAGPCITNTPVPIPQVLNLKALSHNSILGVGQKFIEKLENKYRMEIEEALRIQAEELGDEFKKKMADSGGLDGGEGGSPTKKVVATLMEHFDSCFNELVNTTQLRMRKECLQKVEEERAELAANMFAQMNDQLLQKDRELCAEFHDILYKELNLLASRYIKQINKEREVAVQLLKETVKNYEKMLQDVRTEMELSNVVDVCQAITRERIECNARIREIRAQIKPPDCSDLISNLQNENSVLQKMATERLKRLIHWRKKVRVLLEEFQRFINFSLQTVPGQAEFLLDMEKLLLKKYPEDRFLLPEDYIRFKNCMEGKLSFSDVGEPPKKEEEIYEVPDDLGETVSSDSVQPGETDEDEVHLTFDYDKFKTMLVNKFAPYVKSESKKSKKKAVCLWQKRGKPVVYDKKSVMYRKLTLAGENERQHLAPISCFLRKRLDTVIKVCNDDPEFAKIILGCPDK